ncbi:DUF2577 domain-containing protein [Candidatus Saccharibacteria bacterium]|nr:DUF2577 domain-containing protein [Candidatus Saccharibacteria bacterium]
MPAGDRIVKTMLEAARKATPETNTTDILYGVVQSINPLVVLVDNRLSLTEDFLILSPFCYKAAFDIEVEAHSHGITVSAVSANDHKHSAPDVVASAHKHKVDGKDSTEAGAINITGKETDNAGGFNITPTATCGQAGSHKIHVSLWEDLDVADKLVMLRVAKGQAYMILYRDKLSIKVT